jgi:hypothetical protein
MVSIVPLIIILVAKLRKICVNSAIVGQFFTFNYMLLTSGNQRKRMRPPTVNGAVFDLASMQKCALNFTKRSYDL